MKKIGYFNEFEYVIQNMRPVRPLKNYLWSEQVVTFVDQTGQGRSLACIESNRRTFVKSKRYFYIKNNKTEEIYSPNRNFTDLPFDIYECHVGLGYQTIVSEYKGIRTEITILIPQNDYVELVRVKVVNKSNESCDLNGYYYCDIDANITEHWAYGKGDFNQNFDGLLYPHDHFDNVNDYNLMFAKCSAPIKGWDVSNAHVFGVYGNEVVPDGVKNVHLSCEGTVFDEFYCSAMQVDLSLKAGEEKNLIFAFGIEKDENSAKKVADKYLSLDAFLREYNSQVNQNLSYVDTLKCNTPDEYFDIMTNVWTKRQLSLGKTWGRVYGKGFRDVLQDIAAFLSLDVTLAKKQIISALSHQYDNGNAIRMYEPDFKYPYMDMPAWIPTTVLQYIKETGELSILQEQVPYLDSEVVESLFMHVKRGVDFLLSSRGKYNLILWGGGDWNDSMNNAGMQMKGESVWLAIATVKAINEFIEILEIMGENNALILEYNAKKQELINAIDKYGWDGDHYVYGYADSGEKVGSDENEEGKIYLNPQTWAVLAKIKSGKDAHELMDTVEQRLKCDFGYLQNLPAYQKGIQPLGRSTYFIPGLIENASVYNHGVAFKMAADCMLGRADYAYETFMKMRYDNPLNQDNGVEPYAFSNMYIGPDSPYKKGFAPMCWVTGTGGWMYRIFSENILGIQAEFNGLAIRPNLPSKWERVTVTRKFRGAIYNIEIVRGGEKGIFVNGEKINGDLLPVIKQGETCSCIVYLG